MGKANILLGNRIRSLRTVKGWTQQELGAEADINYKFLGEIERGQQNPSFNVLLKISEALGVELTEFFRLWQEITDRKELESRINQILKSMPTENLAQLLSILRMLNPIE
ncbi:MAG: helix-turn-helix transcriptional regulator [Deltaproteobacteria bacterium]|nr:helix-turn-helix transcriptional regulator [Deltaproteobacteria bacterium]